MTKTAAVAYEVRWRKTADPTNQWSSPVTVGADGHVSVPGLERVTDYVFEARSISACGAKSAWATQTVNLPDAPVGTLTLSTLNKGLNQTGPLVNNPFFITDLTGWSSDQGTWVYQSGTNGPVSGTSQYAYRAGSSANPTDALRNSAKISVVPGTVVKGAANLRGSGADGTIAVRISWRDGTDATEVGTTASGTLTGTFNSGATVVGTAPALAVYAHVEAIATNHTVGWYSADNFAASILADSLDQVPDGGTYGKTLNAYLNGNKPVVNFADTIHTNKSLDYIPDGNIRIGGIQYADGETVDNANFEASSALPVPGWGSAGGGGLSYTPSGLQYAGSQSLHLYCTGTESGARSTRIYKCTPGDVYLLRSAVIGSSYGVWYGCALFYTGATPHSTKVFFSVATGATSWAQYAGQIQVPSGADNFVLAFIANVNSITCAVDDVALSKVRPQSNLMPLTWAGVRSVLSTSPITYSISGTTVTFTVAAFTNYGGGNNPSYSASSGSKPQTAGTTVTYYLYYRDPISAGGSQALYITTNVRDLAAYPDIVNIGSASVTVNSGGGGTGGGGSGGGGFCVADEMFIREGLRAGDAEIGDEFDCIDMPTAAGKHVRALRGVSRGREECVRMITDDGCALVCSVSTPFDLRDGRTLDALRMLGERVVTDLHADAVVVSLALVGPRHVTRAHLGGVSYAAGADPRRRIYSHNAGVLKP